MSQNEYVPPELKTCVLKVTSYEKRNVCGAVYNPCFTGFLPFEGPMELLRLLDGLFDQIHFPRSATKNTASPAVDRPVVCTDPGKTLAAFRLQVLFRQNASWQGSIQQIDTDEETDFRSFRELLYILDNALTSKQS